MDILDLKRHRGWESPSVTESYVQDSLQNKFEFTNQIPHNSNNSVNGQLALPNSEHQNLKLLRVENICFITENATKQLTITYIF